MHGIALMALVVMACLGSGCAMVGEYSFQDLDLKGNLSKETLKRYESEWRTLEASGERQGMAQLEYTNWWPLGLIVYWRQGSVMRMGSSDGPFYVVSRSRGVGPLGVLHVAQTHATFDGKGQRLSGMTVHNVLLGHLAMIHQNDALLANGRRQEMTAMHLVHHLINVHAMDGHTEISLFTGPNPAGVEIPSHPAAHAGHPDRPGPPDAGYRH